ncbi:unnamed protein product [Hermetia illucens]|uniref:Chitin-binding type-2 domain-containing protein n=1 Tax=Hermetia illucens TaxID=343691 RepID=A0A7R8UHL6_HERIL|nr:unnamed protein product [Hermetia illucens]
MKLDSKQIAISFGVLLLVLWDTHADDSTETTTCTSGTASPAPDSDPHHFAVCSDGKETILKCPPLTLYAQGTTDIWKCRRYYGGCSESVAGCVPCQYFPWPNTPASMTPPACSTVGAMGPYCDPSHYWFCSSIYGVAELRECPPGYGFSTLRVFGCVTWIMKMNLQKAALFLCGLLLLLWDANAQSCTSGATSPPASGDPHYYNLCSDGAEVLTECPSSTFKYSQVIRE